MITAFSITAVNRWEKKMSDCCNLGIRRIQNFKPQFKGGGILEKGENGAF